MNDYCTLYGTNNHDAHFIALDWRTQPDARVPSNSLPRSVRGLVMGISDRDVVAVSAVPQDLIDWLHQVGLGLPSSQIWQLGRDLFPLQVKDNAEWVKDRFFSESNSLYYLPFFPSYLDQKAALAIGAQILGNPSLSFQLYDKSNVLKLLPQSVPANLFQICTREQLCSVAERALEKNENIFVRGTLSCSGHSSYKVYNFSDCLKILNHDPNRIFIVEKFVSHFSSPNIQAVIIGDDQWYLLDIYEQLFSGETKHSGNSSFMHLEYKDKIIECAESILTLLSRVGYRYWVGIDFLISPDEGLLFCEVNPRINGSSFIHLLKDKLVRNAQIQPDWSFHYSCRKIRENLKFERILQIIGEDLVLNPSRHQSVFVIPLLEGDTSHFVIFAQTPLEIHSVLSKLEIIFND